MPMSRKVAAIRQSGEIFARGGAKRKRHGGDIALLQSLFVPAISIGRRRAAQANARDTAARFAKGWKELSRLALSHRASMGGSSRIDASRLVGAWRQKLSR